MLKNKICQLFIAVVLGVFIAPHIRVDIINIFYSISESLKSFLMLVLPFLIFFSLSSVLSGFQSAAPLLILGTLVLVILSNAATVLTSYIVGYFTLPVICANRKMCLSVADSPIHSLWDFPFRLGIKNEYALIAGILFGLMLTFIQKKQSIIDALERGKHITTLILKYGFITFLPLYVFGFMLKLSKDGAFGVLVASYGRIFLVSVSLIVCYLFLMYLIASMGSVSMAIRYIKNMLPAGITGFSTMSSMAALPITLQATRENTNDPLYTDYIVPTSANIHMVGDGLNISLTVLALLLMSCQPYPDFSTYLLFTVYYCLYKFTAVGVPGGGVLVILPVAQHYLSLSSELTTLLMTIYFLQDSILTGANVMANGAFAIFSHKIFKRFKIYKG
ncbi:MAG: Serine/threonine transporter SstT [Holosporales bacterium]